MNAKSSNPRRGGLGRGLGALIPNARPENDEVDPNARPLDVLFPNLQGNSERAEKDTSRGGSAKELLSPRQKSDKQRNVSRETSGPQTELVETPGAAFAEISVENIVPNQRQPRQVFEQSDLDELADSIEMVGLLQPVVVRELSAKQSRALGGRYELIMGERRLRATQQLGRSTIPAIIRQASDDALLRDALLENLHRADLNPLEEAAAYAQLLADFSCTQDELAQKIARSRSQIANTLRLLRLPPNVQQLVAAEVLSAGHARALLSLSDSDVMDEIASRIVEEGLSVRATEDLVRLFKGGPTQVSKPSRPKPDPSPFALEAASRVSDLLETTVTVSEGKKRGRIIIDFADAQDLQRIVDLLS